MPTLSPLSFRAPLPAYDDQARILLGELHAGHAGAAWRFKWLHPKFHQRPVDEVRRASLDLDDARVVVAREYAFDGWPELAAFAEAVAAPGPVASFEEAVESVIAGDAPGLRQHLDADPSLAQRRSTRRHHATLLHYLGANGVESSRQRSPSNAVEIATILLDAGADPDALADMYGGRCTMMSMLVSSSPPAERGVQVPLLELLLDRGASPDGPGTKWQSALMTALIFGFPDAARALVRHGAAVDTLPSAAGLGRVADVARLLPDASPAERHGALGLAAQLGQVDVLRMLLDAGEDPDRYNPEGMHAHATPLHHAVWLGHEEAVRLLVERGARLDLRDTLYDGTPLDWAVYGARETIAAYLRSRLIVSGEEERPA